MVCTHCGHKTDDMVTVTHIGFMSHHFRWDICYKCLPLWSDHIESQSLWGGHPPREKICERPR